ncbi:hypothetical protein Nepgr_011604 [Nepenthes gracilis]|uniref:Uncharacterized protein n=1 Tax=Nepenthes gracilis TaxID=150966 RepID=A0AAD3XM32_NEPGR|nr:hypothetical protein Nepgr_011604 [Nepenthes gracilis]
MLMILKLVLWMDLLPGDGGSASGLNPLYLAGLADHPFDPADVLNLPGGFPAGLEFYLDDGLCKPPVWMMWVCVCWAGLATVGSLVVLVSLFRSCPAVGVLGRFGLPADPD